MTDVATTGTRSEQDELFTRTPTDLFIDGEFCPAGSGATFDVVNPATGQVLAQVADAGAADGRRALDAADRKSTRLNSSHPV